MKRSQQIETQKIKRQYLRNRYLPQYGLEILHLLMVKDKFTHCSFAQNSTPSLGSETKPIENCTQPINHEVNKITIHNYFRITLYTDKGNVQYLKL